MSGDQYRDVGNMVGEMKKANNKKYAVGDLVLVGPGRAPGRVVAIHPPSWGCGETYDVVLDRLVVDGWTEGEATVRGVCEHWLAPADPKTGGGGNPK